MNDKIYWDLLYYLGSTDRLHRDSNPQFKAIATEFAHVFEPLLRGNTRLKVNDGSCQEKPDHIKIERPAVLQ